jgi:hypothetical protein
LQRRAQLQHLDIDISWLLAGGWAEDRLEVMEHLLFFRRFD